MSTKGYTQTRFSANDAALYAAMQKEAKLHTGRLLSHCAMISVPTYARRIVISDVL